MSVVFTDQLLVILCYHNALSMQFDLHIKIQVSSVHNDPLSIYAYYINGDWFP